MKKAVFLSNTLIGWLLENQAFTVSDSFRDSSSPTTEQVEDLYEICRAFLADTPDTYQQKFNDGFSVGFDMATAFTELPDQSAVAEPVQEDAEDDGDDQIEDFLSRLPADAIQKEDEPRRMSFMGEPTHWTIDPPLPPTFGEVKLPEPPSAPEPIQIFPPKVDELPEEDAPEKRSMLSISVEKAAAVARLLSRGAPCAARACKIPESHAKAVQSWLCAWFDCGSNSLGRTIKSAEMVEAINKFSEGGFIQIPCSEEPSKAQESDVAKAILPERLRRVLNTRKAEGMIEVKFLDAFIQSGMSVDGYIKSLRTVGGLAVLP